MAETSRERSGQLGVAGGFPLDRFLSFRYFHLLLKHPSRIAGFGFSHQICMFDLPPPPVPGDGVCQQHCPSQFLRRQSKV